ncbi:hypothetical protein M9Y10_024534 [Tritrichomonas musculus]|uniref:Aminopeptidase P N-terminal domain-containing protein n=1 Tax=Tritrichomonas musculus TaxID=1915356 RepID=A0ABR2HC90_9EUKA
MDGKYFKLHRQSVVNTFHQNGINSGVIIYCSPSVQKELFSDSDLSFSQDALFYWLTGWEQPKTHIIIDIATGISTLVTSGYNEYYEIWTGPIPSKEEIINQTGVDSIIDINEMVSFVRSLNPVKIYSTTVPLKDFPTVDNYTLLVASNICRRIKFPHEIAWLRKASELTGETIKKVLKEVKVPMKEKEIEALFKYHGALFGCDEVSFLTIVASGQNSVYLHYTANSGKVNDGDLVLLDCGLFYKHYAGDITRTFPANGKFSDEQKLVYNALLKRQIELCRAVKPGASISFLDSLMYKAVFEVCKEVGAVSNDTPYSLNIAMLFCPHSVSHPIGCNVHDQALFYFGDDVYRPNMVVSVEPGIYFHKKRLEQSRNNPSFNGVVFDRALELAEKVGGIRIEDDLLITDNGNDILSACCPKSVEEIEELMKK